MSTLKDAIKQTQQIVQEDKNFRTQLAVSAVKHLHELVNRPLTPKDCFLTYYQKNKERIKKKALEYYRANKEKVEKQKKIYVMLNKEKISKRRKDYWEQNKEKINASNRHYRASNKIKWQLKNPYDNQTPKICSVCKKELPRTEFPRSTSTMEGLDHLCKTCCSSKWYKKNYNITLQQKEVLLRDQNYKCLVCDQPLIKTGRTRKAQIDHSHSTGKVRGILCPRCNLTIGYIEEALTRNPEVLIRAVKYLNLPFEVTHNEK